MDKSTILPAASSQQPAASSQQPAASSQQPAASSQQTERNHSLDFIKGICILLVVFTHFHWTDEQRLWLLFPFWVDMAVPVFMIITGYLYSKSYEKREINCLSKAYSFVSITNRIIRYTVPFFVIFLVESVVFYFTDNKMSIISSGFFFLRGTTGPGSYYYPVLLQLVFIFPIIYSIIKKYDFRGLVICTCINVIFEVLKSAYYVNADCYRLLSFRYIMVLAFGCYLAIGKKALNWKIYLPSFAIGTVYIIVTQYIGKTPVFTEYWTVTSFWACMYILPMVSWLFHRKKLRFKPIEIIGKASYNIFLVQMVYYLFLSDRVYGFINNAYLELLINILICVLVGLVFYYIETPITKWIIKKVNGLFCKIITK